MLCDFFFGFLVILKNSSIVLFQSFKIFLLMMKFIARIFYLAFIVLLMPTI
jgi:hypothetical protein